MFVWMSCPGAATQPTMNAHPPYGLLFLGDSLCVQAALLDSAVCRKRKPRMLYSARQIASGLPLYEDSLGGEMAQAIDPRWRSASYAPRDRYDAWRHELNDVYGSWNLSESTEPEFQAEVVRHTIQNLRVVHCVCDPCGATRRRAEINRDDRETLAVQLVTSGREHFTLDGIQVVLGPGDVLIWNSVRPMDFEIVERLEKFSVLMPLDRLRDWLPKSWHSIERALPTGTTGANLLSSFIKSMSLECLSGNLRHGAALTEALIGIIIGALDAESSVLEQSTLRDARLFRVKQYIDAHLDDPELSPTLIAQANCISVRYLHSLFEPQGTTVFQYVIKERLLHCRRDLSNPLMSRRTITDIAFSWGFQSSTHFSRRFRDEFGMSPVDCRNIEV